MPDLSALNLAISWALFGLTWIVQLVTYPAFQYVSKNRFGTYHHKHVRHISLVVIPLMLLEFFLAVYFVIRNFTTWEYWLLLVLVIGVWMVTALLAMPLHKQLAKGKDRAVIMKLIRTNGLRTFLWTVKALWLLIIEMP